MDWSEVDLDAGIWTIPGERAKNGRSHRVPLSPQAVEALKSLRAARVAADGKLGERNRAASGLTTAERLVGPVFWARRVNRRPLTTVQGSAERLRTRLRFHFTTHDLRRTAASMIAEAGFGAVVPKILNHTDRSVTAIYDRYSYEREKRAALEVWGTTLARIVATDPADMRLAG